MNALFLEQAANYRASRFDGRPRIVSPPGLGLVCGGLVATLGIALFFLFTGEYARKTTVFGVLEAEDAVKRVYAARSGTVQDLMVVPGQRVTAGTVLVRFTAAASVDPAEKAQAVAGFEAQLEVLETQRGQLAIQRDNSLLRIASEVATLEEKRHRHSTVIALQENRLAELQQIQESARPLFAAGQLSRIEWGRFSDAVLSARQQHAELLAVQASLNEQLTQLEIRARDANASFNRQIAVLAQQSLELKQRRHHLLAEEHFAVAAPVSGTVSAVLVQPGQQVLASESVLTVVPDGTRLYARLRIPSRAVGFLAPGQNVNLLYDAFPHQQFGSFPATLINISDHAMLPREELGIRVPEPFFLARARLSSQFVVAYGEQIPLKSGMALKADVILDRRTLMAWLLEPLLIMKGRTG
ncbi:MAG: HlyD family secretion protein [Pseudomonadota bacterium]